MEHNGGYEVIARDDSGTVTERSGFFQMPETAECVARIWEQMGANNVSVINVGGWNHETIREASS